MDVFEEDYDDGNSGINNQLGKYMSEGSGLVMDVIISIHLWLETIIQLENIHLSNIHQFISLKIGRVQIKDSLQFIRVGWTSWFQKEKGKKDNLGIEETFPTTYKYSKKYLSDVEDEQFNS